MSIREMVEIQQRFAIIEDQLHFLAKQIEELLEQVARIENKKPPKKEALN